MRALVLLALPVMSSASCTVYHHCNARDRALLLESTTPADDLPPQTTAVRYRVLPDGKGDPVDGVGIYTHASQYRPAPGAAIDFDHEEVVRITAAGLTRVSLKWIGENRDEVLVGIVVPGNPCTAYPSPPPATGALDVAIPLTTKPVRVLSRDAGPACSYNGQP